LAAWQQWRKQIADWLGLDLTHSQVHYSRVLNRLVRPGLIWLEVGCGRQILPDWAMLQEDQRQMASRSRLLVGIDVDAAMMDHQLLQARVIGLGGKFPFTEQTFDLLTANMVVEHVVDAKDFLQDVHRVLKPGGAFLFHTPNYLNYLVFIASLVPDVIKKPIIWALEHRRAEDVFPTHYQLNTPNRIEAAARECGLSVERLDVVGSVGSFGALGVIGWLECFLMKAIDQLGQGRWNSNLICILRRPGH
jgi:SAM-dependent methyltransferase